MIRKKILLIGDFNVGKTSLIKRYVDNAFDDKYLTTIGVKISKKGVQLGEDTYELHIWDLEGATPQKPIPRVYYNGASGAIFVGDISRQETINNINSHMEVYHEVNPKGSYVIAYNKSDLLTPEQRKAFVKPEDIFLTSAKDDLNVNAMFRVLAKKIFHD